MQGGLRGSGSPSARRFLLVVRAGDDSLHRNWIAAADQQQFDLLISYYGAVAGRFQLDGEFYHAAVGPAWTVIHEILRDHPWLGDSYDYVGFPDDDLDADTATWNALFAACESYGFDLAQPAILGPVSHEITRPVPRLRYRLTTFVENMCPVFSRRALAICRTSFGDSVSGWGLNHVWPKLLAEHAGRLAIIDSVRVTHTRAVGQGSLYKMLEGWGINPDTERNDVMARNGVRRVDIRELARVRMTVREAILQRVSGYWLLRWMAGKLPGWIED